MKTQTYKYLFYVMCSLVVITPMVVFGQTDSGDGLTRAIENKQAEIDGIKRKIGGYEGKIRQLERSANQLSNEIAILENRTQKTQLDIEENELHISKTELEIRQLEQHIHDTEAAMARHQSVIRSVLKEMYIAGDDSTLEIILGNEQFSDYFDQMQYLELLNDDLASSLSSLKDAKATLSEAQTLEQSRKERLLEMREALESAQSRLESEQQAKDVLLASTERSEIQYRQLIQELRAEQQYINAELFRLQETLEQRLKEQESVPVGPTVLSWPVSSPRITTRFHDPTYPFRHLFEHSGLDMAVPQGSPVRAAAPGYVAWTRTGRSYGNYIMVVHTNGVATLYAHLSRFAVERGQIIGYSGGMPGTPGAGLSTGPHVHFEVREQGIPVDPYGYLVSR
ncbi:peptidoglycan DD-metalloendopeptidase family protein [Candidatus Uhrbacteria bacterium]|nr:peptidoglycan DD-metalloendopeptidase family protein [Candidatus Uhrbacteria bacterium]